jgi:hypothetical protein
VANGSARLRERDDFHAFAGICGGERHQAAAERRLIQLRSSGRCRRGGMLTIVEAQRRTELFLTGQMLEALRAVEYQLPSFDIEPREVELADVAHARVEIRHVCGASDANISSTPLTTTS